MTVIKPQPTPAGAAPAVLWHVSTAPVAYPDALAAMEARAAAIRNDGAQEMVWLLEHPPLYTAGTSAHRSDLLLPEHLPVYQAGRGGQYTYHGPGQRVVYVMLDLERRGRDVRAFVWQLEEWLIRTLALHGVRGERRSGRIGIWVGRGGEREDKIAAIGLRVRRWVTFHGVSVNVAPDLDHYRGIVPCGITGHGVTSLADLGATATMQDVDRSLLAAWHDIFGSTVLA